MGDYIQPLIGGTLMLGSPIIWIFILLGTIVGVLSGAMPGIGPTLVYGIVLPFTFVMDPVNAVAFLLAISVGNMYGNSIPAILMGIPGNSAAILTVIEGHTLHKRGEGSLALAVSFVAALGGQFVSILLFVVLIVPLMQAAYIFMSPEMFSLYLLGMIALISLTGKNVVKGLMACGFGLAIALVGLDPINIVVRFSFGFRVIRSGFEMVPVMIGLLAVSELFRSTRQIFEWGDLAGAPIEKPRFPSWSKIKPTLPAAFFGTIVGTLIGAIPGAGATPSAMISYQQAQLMSKKPEEFGHGSLDGIAANEAAQNASNSGELIPTLALGVPGSGSMALLLSALTVHGFLPGPLMLTKAPDLFYAAVAGMMGSTIFLFLTGWKMATMMLKAVNLSRSAVIVVGTACVVIGVYSQNTRVFDVFVALVSGVIGYFMLRYGYSTAGAALAVVLGAAFERELRIGLNMMKSSWVRFFSRPITGTITFIVLVLFGIGLYRQIKFKKKMATETTK